MKKIITLSHREEWMTYVKRSKKYDFYHTYTYHELDETGVPFIFVYEEDGDFIAFPLIKRDIHETGLFDCSSVFGYSGPISNKDFTELNEAFVNRFKNCFLSFLHKEKIISIFTRLHPYFDQQVILKKFGGVHENGKVISLDLTIPLEEQRSKYQNRVLRQVKQMNKKGYYVKEANDLKGIRAFNSMYTAAMLRIEASNTYLFSEEYFITLLNSQEIDARLLFVYNEVGVPICGAIVAFTNQIIQAHLLATDANYYSESPAKLLTDEITILGRKLGMKYYNLGGGLGYKEDSLFNWKLAFSKQTFNFYSWRYIVNRSLYNDLLVDFDINPNTPSELFPLYRFGLQAVR